MAKWNIIPKRTLEDHASLMGSFLFNTIVRHEFEDVREFEIKPTLIHFIQANQFHGYVHRSPYDHISTFNDIFNTVKISHVSDNALTLCLLSFSSTGDALSWLRSFPPISLSLWEDVVAKLLKNYFPKSKTLKGKVDISLFQQMHDEALSEACERYQSLLWQTPTHGFDKGLQINIFLGHLHAQSELIMDAATWGKIVLKTQNEASAIIENMAYNDYEFKEERELMHQKETLEYNACKNLIYASTLDLKSTTWSS